MSKSVCQLVPGRAYSFDYPRHNFDGVLSKLERRRIKVESIRDLREDPLERITFEIQPLLRRGRLLITGIDLDKGQERSFYLTSMKSVAPVLPRKN